MNFYLLKSMYMRVSFKKYFRVISLSVFVLAISIVILLFNSCNKNKCVAPVIDYLTFRDSTESINYLVPSQIITVHGTDLEGAGVFINNTPINPLYILDYDTTLTFRMPYISSNSDADELSDSLLIVKECGSDLMMVNILLAPPYITKISNEYAVAGDIIILDGYYFSLLESVVFPGNIEGEIVPEYTDTICQIIVPEGVTDEGAITLTSQSGEGSSATGVKFRNRTGLLCNFDDVDTWDGWGGRVISHNNDVSIPEANGRFYAGKRNLIEPGSDSISYLTLPISGFTMPDFSGSLTPDYFSLKFEIYSLYPWESGYYKIELGSANDQGETEFAYEYDFQPWNDTIYNGTFTTPQWETYGIPLSEFRLKTNNEIPIQSYSQIRTCNYMLWTFENPPEEDEGQFIDHFCVGIDNLRIVKVKSEE